MSSSWTGRIPWLRLGIEGVVILVSILLAFGIDAAWAERSDRREEAEALASLRSEFSENVARLDSTLVSGETTRTGVLNMLRAIRERGIPAGSYEVPDSVLTNVGGAPIFQPASGALSALLGSQGLILIRDDSLRTAIAAWPGQMADIARFADMMSNMNLQNVVPILHRHVPYISVDYRASSVPGLEGPSRFADDYVGLLENREFENWLDLQLIIHASLSAELTEARDQARWIISRIDSR